VNLTPTRKVGVGAAAGAITAIAIYLLEVIWGIKVPGDVASQITVLVIFVVQWFVPEKKL